MEADITAGPLSGPEEHYFERLTQGVFELQKCGVCNKHQFFPRVLCVHCGSEDLTWVEPSGKGTIYSYSIVRRKLESGGDYNVVLVDLEEGARLMSRLEGVEPDKVRIGQAVRARVVQEDGVGRLVFDCAEASDA